MSVRLQEPAKTKMQKIAIIDYGIGNLYSVVKALEQVAGPADHVLATAKPEEIAACDRVVFPGQGAAKDCMQALRACGLEESVLEAARNKPFLGICMGMQVLMRESEENQGTGCLAFYEGSVKYFGNHVSVGAGEGNYKVPHMGWNGVRQDQATRFGTALHRPVISISCTVISYTARIRPWLPAPPSTVFPLPPPLRKTTSLPCSAIRRKAPEPACACCRTSCVGTVKPASTEVALS